MAAREDIVITGFSARFPQADSLAEFKEKLYAGVDFVTDDETRWPRGHLSLPKRMGKIRDLSRFDAEFFGVPPKQAHLMDPQMRLLLETTYEAIVDAGYDPAELRGRGVGVFIGCYISESHEAFNFDADKVDGYGFMGSSQSLFANRISYSFDFHGPSMAIDTVCSSTMTALDQAVLSLRSGKCEAAIVGGSTICLKAATSLSFQRLGILSPDGKCMSFDHRANGYVRSETVGAFLLQRAPEARRIYAKIVHIKAYSDGHKNEGIAFPSSQQQEQLLRDVYAEASMDLRRVEYVEAHGTGTQAGDSRELCAIWNVFCRPGRDKPLKVGTIRSNIGHAEAASGVGSVAKVILAMETGTIAGNLHFREANPNIPSLHDGSIEVVDKGTPFSGDAIGINSFGMGGSTVHAILEPCKGPHVDNLSRDKAILPRLVFLAGRSKMSLEGTLDRLESQGPYADPAYALLNRVGEPSVKAFPYRGFAVIPVDGSGKDVTKLVDCVPFEKLPLWFVFTGMGSQWNGMARQMMHFDVFASSMRKSHDILAQFGVDLIDVVTNDQQHGICMASVQSSITAIQVALVDMLGAVGVQPDGMLGHSMGEIACAYADGCLTAQQALMCSYWREHCIDLGNLPNGAMAVVGLTWEEAAKRCRDDVVPACHNAEDSVTLSGPAEAVADLVAELRAEGVFVRMVDSMNVAFHSQHMRIIAPEFRDALNKNVAYPKPRSKRWVSSTMPESRWDEPIARNCSAEYVVKNLVDPVLFHEALLHVPKEAIIIEIGPHCLLQAILRRTFGSGTTCLGLMKRNEDNLTFFLKSLGKLHTLGVRLDLCPLYPPVTFPVPRGTPSIGHLVSWDHSQQWTVAKWNEFAGSRELSEEVVEVNLESNEKDAYLAGHQLDGRVVFPAAGYMLLAWKSLTKRYGKPFHEVPVVFEDATFHRATILPKSGVVRFKVHVMPASGEFEISEAGMVAASGRIRALQDGDPPPGIEPPRQPDETVTYELQTEEVYKGPSLRGYEYHGKFRSIIRADIEKPYGKLKWEHNWVTFIDGMFQFFVFLDPLRRFRLFTKIESCLIDLHLHDRIALDVGDKGMDVVYDSCLNTCHAGGVAIRGLKASTAPRRGVHQTPYLEEYQFVPYIDDEAAIEKREACLREYVAVCSSLVRCILEASKEEITKMDGLIKQSGQVPQEVLKQYIESNAENNGLLRVLVAILTKARGATSPLVTLVPCALATHKDDLCRDILSTALLEEDPLRPLLDIAVENSVGRKIKVLELASEGRDFSLTPSVSKLLFLSDCLLRIEYVVAHPRPGDLAPKGLPEGVEKLEWDLESASTSELPEAELVIAHGVPSGSKRLEKFAEQLHAHCKERGFALLCLRTALTPAEIFLSQIDSVPMTAHTKDAVIRVLTAYGFRLVGLKSNNLSTLLLLRKTPEVTEALKQETIRITNAQFDWVETLKAKMLEYERKPSGQKLWLIAEDTGVSGVVGLMNCLRLESGATRVRCLFDATLEGSGKVTDLTLGYPHCKMLTVQDLVMNVRRDGKWGSFRHLTMSSRGASKNATEYAFVNVQTRGDFSSLQWYESPLCCDSSPRSEEKIICSVYYAPVNFRDVMVATGKLPPDALPDDLATADCLLGQEFSGRDTQGRRVMGCVPAKGMATAVAVDPLWLWDVPDAWSLEEASTVPIAYSTAYYALLVRGNMRPGESLLVHSGSGGVGQAAISIALSMGCTVFTTVGSKEKHDFLKHRFPQLTDRNISSSRDLSFEAHVLRETRGRGVNLVLNSLSEEKLQASLRCLANHGRFLEIGKVDMSEDSSLGMAAFLKSTSFHGILVESLQDDDPFTAEDKRRVAELVREGITTGAVRPLNTNLFRWDQVEEAFRFMASSRHTGKVVLEVRPEESPRMTCSASPLTVEAVARTYFYEHKSYAIVGGLGGVGLELADWMVTRGCRKLLLSARSGVRSGYQRQCLQRWRHDGTQVIVTRADISTEEGARQTIEEASSMGPVGGIFNLAIVLCDALFENQTPESFDSVYKPKAVATQRLDELSRQRCPELDHFVVFSSLACGRGNVGQTNYAHANSVAERICERRIADGLPGLAIQWGPIDDVGMLRRTAGGDVKLAGYAAQRITSCMNVLDQLLGQSKPVVSCCVKADDSAKCEEMVATDLVHVIGHIFGVKDPLSLNPSMSLGELGLDSLMGVEVQQTLERGFDLSLSMSEIRELTFIRLREIGGSAGKNAASSGATD